MLSLKKIIALGVVDAFELREKAVLGDLEAANAYLIYSVWKKISPLKDYSKHAKIKALAIFANKMEVKWQTASS